MTKMGRPKKRAAEKQEHAVMIRFNAMEMRELKRVAGKEPVAHVCKQAVMRMISQVKREG